jgi:sulfite exporter TauE/SafE
MVNYALIGAVCGLLGAALDLGASMVGLNRAAAILAGVTMIGVGVVAVLRYRGIRLPTWPTPGWLQGILMRGQRLAVGLGPLPRALTIGLLTAFLPCGWLYAFALIAAGSGSALWGAGIMLAFWAGTVPILASLGVAVQTLTGSLGRRLPLATAVLLVALGLGTLAERWALSGESIVPQLDVSTLDTAAQIEAVSEDVPPCCREDPSEANSVDLAPSE